MTNRKKITSVLALSLLMMFVQACNLVLPSTKPTAASTSQPIPGADQTQVALPRITPQDAKAALESGQAIIVDVRGTEAFLAGHIPGAVSIPLTQIEGNPNRVHFDKTQWIITYCT